MFDGKAVNTAQRERHINKDGGIKGKQEELRQNENGTKEQKKRRNEFGRDVPSLFTNPSAPP